MLQINLVGPLKSSQFKYVLSGIDVFTKYLFVVPLSNGYADTVARELVKVFFQHSYIPQTILSDLGTNFTSELMSELASLLEVKLKHASLKHPQTIGAVERSHGPLKRILKLNTEEQWKDWHKYVPLATFIHNTSYHLATNCCPSTLFHGRKPIKPLDIRFSRKVMDAVAVNSDFVNELQDAMMQKFGENKEKLTTAYLKYKKYYDQKASAKPIPEKSFCLILNPKLLEQSTVIASQVQKWLPLYKVEKVLTDSNYIFRKVNTNCTQCVHRIRLKPIKPSETPEDLEVINPENCQPDPSRRQHMEPDLFDKHIAVLIIEQEKEIQQSKTVKHDQLRVTIKVPLGGPLAGPAAAAPPAVPPAQPRVVAPAVRPRTATAHLPVFDSSSSDEAILILFEENSSSNENLSDLNLDAEIARIPVDPLIADEIREQEPEMRVPLVSYSSDDEMFSPLQQPQTAIVPLDIESPPETHEEQFALTDRKLRARPYNPKRKPAKSAFKSPYQQRKNVKLVGFKLDRQLILHEEDRTNPYLINTVRRSGSPKPRNARVTLEQEEKREAIKASAQASKQSITPSRDTKLDEIRARIAKYAGQKSCSSVNRPVTRSLIENSSPGSSNQNLNHFSPEINAIYLSSPTDILHTPHFFAHCIPADLAKAKGLARQVKSWYPAAPSATKHINQILAPF